MLLSSVRALLITSQCTVFSHQQAHWSCSLHKPPLRSYLSLYVTSCCNKRRHYCVFPPVFVTALKSGRELRWIYLSAVCPITTLQISLCVKAGEKGAGFTWTCTIPSVTWCSTVPLFLPSLCVPCKRRKEDVHENNNQEVQTSFNAVKSEDQKNWRHAEIYEDAGQREVSGTPCVWRFMPSVFWLMGWPCNLVIFSWMLQWFSVTSAVGGKDSLNTLI